MVAVRALRGCSDKMCSLGRTPSLLLSHALLLLLFMLPSLSVRAGGEMRIWQDTRVRNKSVTLVPYLPASNRYGGLSVIVCPGGSYCWHDYEVEGQMVAQWLQSEGIAAFVLKYRVQGIFPYITHSRAIFGGNSHPDMIEDIQRAIQLVRENASQYGVNPSRVGAMGFSAGGHLVMSSACYNATDFLLPHGIHSTVSLRPDFVAPIYPVVSMSHPDTHKRSRRALLGEWKKHRRSMRDSLSLEKHVPANCPPVFLVNCVDDPIVRYHNSELLDSALTLRGIPHRYIQYKTGGHGFGASTVKGTAECRQWKQEFIDWIRAFVEGRKD